jgi:hypothetical protein
VRLCTDTKIGRCVKIGLSKYANIHHEEMVAGRSMLSRGFHIPDHTDGVYPKADIRKSTHDRP